MVSRADLVRTVLNPQIADLLARHLVAVGLWHAPGHDCDRCPPVPHGHWLYHDWFAMGYTPAKQATVNKAKRQELKDPKLVAQVWARDCIDPDNPTIGRCRYCGVELKRKDTRSQKKPHLDHVDPRKAAGISNVVLACGPCNQQKGNRTPREAGMTLLPPPRPTPQPTSQPCDGGPAPTGAPGSAGRRGNGEPVSTRQVDVWPAAGSSRGEMPPTDGAEASGFAGPTEVSDSAGRPENGRAQVGAGADRPTVQTLHRARPVTPVTTGARPPSDHAPDHAETTLVPPPDQPGPAVPRGRGPGQGQGQGQGEGSSLGLPLPVAQRETPAGGRRRRRRRSRGGSSRRPAGDLPPEVLDAGLPPPGVQAPAGGQGSPWHGWHGPPSPVTETDCPTHHRPEPCQQCGREQDRK
ncbi:HNH endonuclease [Gordonia desulfuricans]|nr:HNH endonuclease [Gordonia desulfuricans]